MYCLEIAEKCMFYPGKVENWVVLVNLEKIGYIPHIPFKVINLTNTFKIGPRKTYKGHYPSLPGVHG